MPMVRKMFLGITFFALSILFISPVFAAEIEINYDAELNKICKPMNCVVPIPTLVNPNEDIIKVDQDFYLTGLTWNNTRISIYVDEIYQGEAVVINDDDSDTANFYFLIENDFLLEGQHKWKVIAWTESMHKRSYISTENSFTIESYFVAPSLDKVTTDIKGNKWLIGTAGDNSIVSIYVDNVYQGEIGTDGNFNYNLGILSPGLHTIYGIARDVNTGKLSRRSNLLSEQIEEFIIEEPVISEELEEIIVEEEIEEVVVEEIEKSEEPVISEEPEETAANVEDQISSISETNEEGLKIYDEEENGNIDVIEEEIETEVIITQEASQDKLVVDDQKSEISNLESDTEETEREITATEELQSATPSEDSTNMIMEELDIVEKQERNRKVGLWLLVILIVVVVTTTSFSGKKLSKSKEKEEKEKQSSHQGDLFKKE